MSRIPLVLIFNLLTYSVLVVNCDRLSMKITDHDVHFQDEHVPAPIVQADNRGLDSVAISWQYQRAVNPQYRLLVNVINVIGSKFGKDVNSNIRSVIDFLSLPPPPLSLCVCVCYLKKKVKNSFS